MYHILHFVTNFLNQNLIFILNKSRISTTSLETIRVHSQYILVWPYRNMHKEIFSHNQDQLVGLCRWPNQNICSNLQSRESLKKSGNFKHLSLIPRFLCFCHLSAAYCWIHCPGLLWLDVGHWKNRYWTRPCNYVRSWKTEFHLGITNS